MQGLRDRDRLSVADYQDAAVSGAHVQRAEMQQLLAAARTRGGSPFRAVLVDDLSRLSRDLGNTWQIVFHDLAAADVKVIDVTTRMSSDGAGARLTFGAMALVNDTFLQLVRTETHRGLEGRALRGFWTGGRCYGYTTELEESPPDPMRPRKRCITDPAEAAVVRRVFRLFAEGMALKPIASRLNEEGIPGPNDGGRGNKNGRGWGHTTIRAMLRNERYLGQSVWNQSKWVRVHGRKSRKRVQRPEREWVRHEYPELAIVPKDLWDQVQARFRHYSSVKGGRPAASGRYVYLVSGLLRCGVCGGSMTVIARKVKNGIPYARFGCTTHYSRGASICPNGLSVSETKASRALIDALKEKLDRPELVERFVTTFKQRAASLSGAKQSVEDRQQRARDCGRRIANLTEALARSAGPRRWRPGCARRRPSSLASRWTALARRLRGEHAPYRTQRPSPATSTSFLPCSKPTPFGAGSSCPGSLRPW